MASKILLMMALYGTWALVTAHLCEQERAKAEEKGMIGVFVPQCDSRGFFKPQQHWGSTGESWCVSTHTGQELPGTRTRPGAPPVDCNAVNGPSDAVFRDHRTDAAEEVVLAALTKCEQERAHAQGGRGFVGAYIPQCDSNGLFKRRQYWGSTGMSWCVDPQTGQELPGTRTRPGDKPVDCNAVNLHAVEKVVLAALTKCEQERAHAQGGRGFVGAYIPQCDSNGLFKRQQYWGSTGMSWCVDPQTGQELPGTRTRPGDKPVDCNAVNIRADAVLKAVIPPASKCEEERAKGQQMEHMGLLGIFVPECDSKGLFQRQQHFGSTGMSWCVDPHTGKAVPGTSTKAGASPVNCNALNAHPKAIQEEVVLAAVSSCAEERAKAQERQAHGMVGVFVPQCDSNGLFAPQQHWGSTGMSWCVNTQTGQKLPGTTTSPGKTPVDCNTVNTHVDAVLKEVVLDVGSKCEHERVKALTQLGHGMVGVFVPQCDASGLFKPQQSWGSTGMTWCVNTQTGQELPGTRTPPGVKPINC